MLACLPSCSNEAFSCARLVYNESKHCQLMRTGFVNRCNGKTARKLSKQLAAAVVKLHARHRVALRQWMPDSWLAVSYDLLWRGGA